MISECCGGFSLTCDCFDCVDNPKGQLICEICGDPFIGLEEETQGCTVCNRDRGCSCDAQEDARTGN